MKIEGIEANYHSTIAMGAESWLVYRGVIQETAHKKGIMFFAFLEGHQNDVTCRSSLKAIRSFIFIGA